MRRTTCRQIASTSSIGIHHVPVAQKNTVKPLMNGSIEPRNGASGALMISSEPARAEISIAPMLIQYGGARSAGAHSEIGRACDRARGGQSVYIAVGAVTLNKKNITI